MKAKRIPKRRKYKSPSSNTLLSGGIRVEKKGLYEVLCECTIIHGSDNFILYKERFAPGMRFNSVWDSTHQSYWLDVVPVWSMPSKQYFKRIGDCIAATEVDKINSKITRDLPWFDFMCKLEKKYTELQQSMRDKDASFLSLRKTLDDMKEKIRKICE